MSSQEPSELDEIRKALRNDFKNLYMPGYTIDYKTQRMLRNIEIGIMRLEAIQYLIDRKTVEARIDELKRTAVNPYYPGGPSKEDAVVYVKQIRNRIQQLTGDGDN